MKKSPKTKLTIKDVIPTEPWKFFLYITGFHRKWATFAMLVVALAATASVYMSYFFKLIIDAVEQNNLKAAMFWGLMYPVSMFSIQLMYRLSGYLGMRWTVGSNKTAMDTLMSYLIDHSHGYFIDRFAGSITNKVKNVVGAFEQIIPDLLWSHLNAVVSFLVTFILMLRVDILSAGLFVGLILTLFLVNQRFAPGKVKISRDHAESGTILQGGAVDLLSNAATVRQYAQQKYEMAKLQELSFNRYTKSLANWSYTEKLLTINSFVIFLFALGIFWLLVTKWGQGGISTGEFVFVLALVSNITGALLFIGRAFNATARTVGELREGLEDILLPYEIVDTARAQSLKVTEGNIEWKNVSFDFSGLAVFTNFDLTIRSTERLGLVGSSGAGKSTFVSLLLRQHELSSGKITIDGKDISKVTQDSLREAIALVPQDPALFHRTIRENIAYSKPEATLEEVIEVAKKAQAHDFIERLPLKYDTLVGERGVKLSGGQKQRVAIARAMLKNAPILILDEATSALDSESEKEIQKALHILMEGKTVIAIAHRLSTLREMDRIIVLEEGKIAEDGAHATLVAQGGIYARLWGHQAGGFIQE